MYISLYRKFRPDTFDKMVRQEHIITVLKNQIENNAVGHAYLFCGPRGTGKTSVARIFARAVNCEHPVNGSPCGECAVCRALKEGSLDITEIDAASNNGVNEMRDLREKVQYPPVTGKYKVYIIDEVHMLTDSAFNALLKTLEEPPAHAIFILATTEPHKIPATILSRCMRLDFKLIPEQDLEAHLTQILDEIGKPYEKEAVAAIARAGAGSDRDMLSIAEMCISYEEKLTYEGVTSVLGAADFQETCALCRALLLADMPSALETVERILSEGKAVGVLCRDILQTLNQIALAKTCANAEQLLSLPKESFRQIQSVASEADGRAILRATEIFAKAETDLRFVSSPRVCLETAIMKTAVPAADENIDVLLVRISLLERAVAQIPIPISSKDGTQTVSAIQEPKQAEAEKTARTEKQFSFPNGENDIPPDEEPIFNEAYFSDGTTPDDISSAHAQNFPAESIPFSVPSQKKTETGAAEEKLREETPKKTEQLVSAPMTAELAFGKFMRTLRKTSKNGVLFTMCSDLEAQYEDSLLVLYTASATVFRSLSRPEHREIMKGVFEQLGVSAFEVRMKGETQTKERDAVAQLKEDFKGYPIEIK